MASKGSSGGGGAVVEIGRLSVEQLKSLKEQADLEVNVLQDSLNNIRIATSRLEAASTALHDMHPATVEIIPYFADSFGNESRIDYGTGHETNFVAWMYCLARLDLIKEEDYAAFPVWFAHPMAGRNCEYKINMLKSNYDQIFDPSLTPVCATLHCTSTSRSSPRSPFLSDTSQQQPKLPHAAVHPSSPVLGHLLRPSLYSISVSARTRGTRGLKPEALTSLMYVLQLQISFQSFKCVRNRRRNPAVYTLFF